MPEFVNISVGSLPGTRGLDATIVCPLDAKKSRKIWRISETEMRVLEGVMMLGVRRSAGVAVLGRTGSGRF